MPTASGFPTVQERRRKDNEAIEKARHEEQLKRDEEARKKAAEQQKEKEQLEQAAPLLQPAVEVAEEFLRDSLGLKGATFGSAELVRFGQFGAAWVNGQNTDPTDYPCRIYESRPWMEEIARVLDDPSKVTTYLGAERLEQHRRDRYTNRPGHYMLGDGFVPWWAHSAQMMAVCLAGSGLLQLYVTGLSASKDDYQLLAEAMSKRTGMRVYITQFGDMYHPWNFTSMAVYPAVSSYRVPKRTKDFKRPSLMTVLLFTLGFLLTIIVLIGMFG